jgi:hypothetical protein
MPYELIDMQNPATVTIDATQAETNAELIFNELSNVNLKSRSELLNNFNIAAVLTLNAGLATDAEQEAIVGKIINITDVTDAPVETIKLIVVAQSIQDIAYLKGSLHGSYDQGIDKVTATQKAVATIQKNSITNKFKIIKFEYINN